MEKVKFILWPAGEGVCRIEASDCRTVIRNMADGACIMTMPVLISEMCRITEDCRKIGYIAEFEMGKTEERRDIV